MFEVKIYVHHKASILDPQGEAVLNALHRLSYSQVSSITQGKYFEANIEADSKEAAKEVVESICKDLLVNHNMEAFEYELKDVAK
ncbi:phosphoribosylformylglycinamidine synthase subunit PurS [Apilactobacillus apinorum]|uniref:phosphoribosylformylglycinamidine synthase subunit PurS n=1 Tax=Apilactobacillus apinorum TaxID=1218495 RepID=UPI0006B4BCAA|nr:phosphoribosylformylglycinamidine synthase subunit PurS [Apilactobacillus apinorum]KOY68151.1 Phosphoribosylformylglycinamidine (FGAM) synthase, PurS component [Apilactobacillus apinorum]CAI2692570.1 Phosphoribosylformylglycinamidine (FGAM) synthase, PurS component [Apilactobacillus apinorum]